MSPFDHCIQTMVAALQDLQSEKYIRGGGQPPLSCGKTCPPELASLCGIINRLLDKINETYRFGLALSEGNIDFQASRDNVLAMPLKALQANLRHLTWQAERIATGDLSQQIYFMGDFSSSFNELISSLQEKRKVEERLRVVTEVVGEGIYMVDEDGVLAFINPEAENLLGYSQEELVGKNFHNLIHIQCADGTYREKKACELLTSMRAGQPYRNADDVFTCKNGKLLHVAITSKPIFEGKEVRGAVVAFHDISERKKYQESLRLINEILEKQASLDPLTGLYNRKKFAERLQVEMKRSLRQNAPLALLIFDIDLFKSINDSFGHNEGDRVLTELSRLILNSIRETDIFARWGGEEFVIALPSSSLEQAAQAGEKLRQTIASFDFRLDRPVTCSFGLAMYQRRDSQETLTARADEALYEAKRQGRNCLEFLAGDAV